MKPVVQGHSIVVFGNIASGKSTLAKGILRALPNFQYACMDRLRVDREQPFARLTGVDKERRCEEALLALAHTEKDLLYETTAATLIYGRMSQAIRGYRRGKLIYIRTTCDYKEAMFRFRYRKASGHVQEPPPFRNRMSIEDCWYHFEDKIRAKADLIINTEKHNADATLKMALEHIGLVLRGQ